ncbi:MAG TPA: putative DNA modification/repair radical SAM protein [Methylomirabilota bacterium]|nr:putative DNA modification/repair radical SAM protein [Methylomirabilota bacterium]
MELEQKLSILADAAKYDASCVSSGSVRRNSSDGRGMGSTGPQGICHSFTPDGRCVSLLKILLTNFCVYDCLYCVNRKSSDIPRARFTPEEVVYLTLEFYKRNYIEGLFLSSGIIRNPDYTMEQIVTVARRLRVDHDFRGYLHLKTIPQASQQLIDEAGLYADRISINVELPTQADLNQLAPEKNLASIDNSMARMQANIHEAAESSRNPKAPRYAPAGQSTQIIVGATPATDHLILSEASRLYRARGLKRVYYSAFSPTPHPSSKLPSQPAPLLREHRLYQADWLLRFYNFRAEEIITPTAPNLDLHLDPKTAWAVQRLHLFPVNVQSATREELLRVPGLGVRNVETILKLRRLQKIRLQDLIQLRVRLKKVLPFVVVADHRPSSSDLNPETLRARFAPQPEQLGLFPDRGAA